MMTEEDKRRVSAKIEEVAEPIAREFVREYGGLDDNAFIEAVANRLQAKADNMVATGKGYSPLDKEIDRCIAEMALRHRREMLTIEPEGHG